jgi:hypothetical protein
MLQADHAENTLLLVYPAGAQQWLIDGFAVLVLSYRQIV